MYTLKKNISYTQSGGEGGDEKNYGIKFTAILPHHFSSLGYQT
jgi:hypothetical protein